MPRTPKATAATAKAAAPAKSTTKPVVGTGAHPAASSKATKTPAGAKSSAAKRSAAKAAPGGARKGKSAFLDKQRQLLLDERSNYLRQANELKAQADLLAAEQEPGDVQFDEEGGEGGTANVDRELDLVLSAQAHAAISDIDHALGKLELGTYGLCEKCGQPIPEARLEALPHAALCVACKSGGLSSRR